MVNEAGKVITYHFLLSIRLIAGGPSVYCGTGAALIKHGKTDDTASKTEAASFNGDTTEIRGVFKYVVGFDSN